MIRRCKHCRKPLDPDQRSHALYCSTVCKNRARRNRTREALLIIQLANPRNPDDCAGAIARAQHLLKGTP